MLHIGCHLSSSKGFLSMGETAISIHADTFQFFTRNPRGSRAKAMDPNDAGKLVDLAAKHQFSHLLAHAPYTLNAASGDPKVMEFAVDTMKDDLQRMEFLPGNYYNFHPGSHVGQGSSEGIRRIADVLNQVLSYSQTTTVLLETMSGKGTEIGRSFEELRQILDLVEQKEKMGICLDTCHVHDAGYDIVHDLDGVLRAFDSIIGIGRLKAVHLNDSMNVCGSHKDRHQKIGQGEIGIDSFKKIINHKNLRGLPFYLETPNELLGYACEIELLRGLYEN